MAYSEKLIDHFEHPRNVGTLDKNAQDVGTGMVGAPACGDVMRLQIKVNPEGVIEDAKFKTYGCGSAIASSSLVSEWVKGKTLEEAGKITNAQIADELALPPVKIHCSILAEDAVKAAIADVISIVLFGDTGRIGSRKSGGSRIAYQKYYDDRRDDRREYGRPRAAVGFEYDDIIFETRGDADLVLDQLESAIAKYEVASVADLYDLAGVTCRNYTANRYGWSDIQSAKVVRTSEGYVIRLPRAVQIN